MAIDLFCYASLTLSDCDRKLSELHEKRRDLFEHSFVLYAPRSADNMQREIAKDYAFERCVSTFLVSLNEKQHAGRVPEVAEVLKKQLGAENVLILQNNDFVR